jgi:hypothetical protein
MPDPSQSLPLFVFFRASAALTRIRGLIAGTEAAKWRRNAWSK